MDKLKTNQALGQAVKAMRSKHNLTATALAKDSGRSRDILHRLECGQDVSVSSLLDILRAAGYAIQLVPAGLPTMEEMQAYFAEELDE